jgi:hypothetical protein
MGILDQAVINIPKEKEMNKFLKKLFRIDKTKAEPAQVNLSPKEKATANKEPWVAVLDTHVNKDNIRNGFFELDWNEYFVLQLRASGYNGETDEAIVDQWFSELCRNVGAEDGVNMDRRGTGYINVNSLGNGKTEVF